MNINKPLFFAFILLSTSLVGFGQSANSQVSSSKTSEVAVASGSKRSKIASREIKRGWKNFQANGMEIQLPSYYEGGNTKNNPQDVIQEIEKAGMPSGSLTNDNIKDYELFAVNLEEARKGNIDFAGVIKQKLPASGTTQLIVDGFAKGISQNTPNTITEKKVIYLDNYEAGKVVYKDIDPQTNKVKNTVVSYLFEKNQTLWVVLYATSSESQLQKKLAIFKESANTFRINAKS
ncbi:MAG: hypothetical protein SWZ49_14925 [Cyanobacteriota bacterium]|nr:hypothetical protein [Cyanobacteriota bacterium]